MTAPYPLPTAVAEVFITDELDRRASKARDFAREKIAMQDLARQMAEDPEGFLPRLVFTAMDIAGATSAGVSILEGDRFRWYALCGELSVFEGATTPRNDSPCGVCIDFQMPILMERPERAYGWIRNADIAVPEVLLVPLCVSNDSLGTLWIVAKEGRHFDQGHAKALSELAAFAGIALRMIKSEQALTRALAEQETLTREMGHRVKNLFSICDSILRMTARRAVSKEQLVESYSGRLQALSKAHGLVRSSFSHHERPQGVTLGELIGIVLAPYDRVEVDGPDVVLGEHTINAIALVFHELATNAAKYGALTTAGGTVDVAWRRQADNIVIDWIETGGPAVSEPAHRGFGSALASRTISGYGGTLHYDWRPAGLAATITLPEDRLLRG